MDVTWLKWQHPSASMDQHIVIWLKQTQFASKAEKNRPELKMNSKSVFSYYSLPALYMVLVVHNIEQRYKRGALHLMCCSICRQGELAFNVVS